MKNVAACIGVAIAAALLAGCDTGSNTSQGNPSDPTPPPSAGSVALTWEAPNQHADGRCFTDLSGYRVYRGPTAGNYTDDETVMANAVSCSDSGTSNTCGAIQTCTYTVHNLPSGPWHFSLQAFDAIGASSGHSNMASTVVP